MRFAGLTRGFLSTLSVPANWAIQECWPAAIPRLGEQTPCPGPLLAPLLLDCCLSGLAISERPVETNP